MSQHRESIARDVRHRPARFDAGGPPIEMTLPARALGAARARVGGSNRVVWILVGDACASRRGGSRSGAIANATVRALRQLGEGSAAQRLAAAVHAELALRHEATGDLWLDLASETAIGFADALIARLVMNIDPSSKTM